MVREQSNILCHLECSGTEKKEQVFWTGWVDLIQGPDINIKYPHILDIQTPTILSLCSEQVKVIPELQKAFLISRIERSKNGTCPGCQGQKLQRRAKSF